MPKYFKAVGGCKKCARKRIFSLNGDDDKSWVCPYDSPECSGEIVQVSWVDKNKSTLIKVGALALVAFLLFNLFSDGEAGKVEDDLLATQKRAQTFTSEVRGVPQNRGANDPYKDRWVAQLANRTKRLKSQITPIRQDLEKLKEYEQSLTGEYDKALKLPVPEFAAVRPLKKYSELKSDGRSLISQLGLIKGKARSIEEKGLVVRANICEKKVKKDMRTLKGKSVPIGATGSINDPLKVKKLYQDEIKNTQKLVTEAIDSELARMSRLAEEARLRRLAEAEAERLKSAQQRLKEWNEAHPEMSIKVSNALLSSLIEPLIRGYFNKSGDTHKRLTSPSGLPVVRYTSASLTIEVSEGSSLVNTPLVIEVRDRATSKENSRVIALDAMVVVGGSNAPSTLVASDLEKIIAGQITNWSQVGGGDSSIKVIVPDAESGDAAVIGEDTRALIDKNRSKLISTSVAKDSVQSASSFGLCSFHNSTGSNRVGVKASDSSLVFTPTPSSISSENYRYTKRVYIDLPSDTNESLESFLNYVEGSEGQKKVSECGFIDLRIDLVSKPLDSFALPIIAKAFGVSVDDIVSAYRLNTNFRFGTNSSNLDTKARADIERVQRTLNIHTGSNKKALIVGYTDSDGAEIHNKKLSNKRGNQVFSKLITKVRKSGSIKFIGEGESHPISDNNSNVGKSQNRRVEVWIVELN